MSARQVWKCMQIVSHSGLSRSTPQKNNRKNGFHTCRKGQGNTFLFRFVLIRPLHVHLSNSLAILPPCFYTSTRGKGKSSYCGLLSRVGEAYRTICSGRGRLLLRRPKPPHWIPDWQRIPPLPQRATTQQKKTQTQICSTELFLIPPGCLTLLPTLGPTLHMEDHPILGLAAFLPLMAIPQAPNHSWERTGAAILSTGRSIQLAIMAGTEVWVLRPTVKIGNTSNWIFSMFVLCTLHCLFVWSMKLEEEKNIS